jgi:hypothetical protein
MIIVRKSCGGLVCAIKAVPDWIISTPLLQPPYITTLLRPCRVQIPLSLPCLCLRVISADQLVLVSRLPARTQFFERRTTVIRCRIYPHWDASPVDTPFEHAYVNILGWLCASANT